MSELNIKNFGERLTFRELFKRHPNVEIPIIQRDYVQGRASEVEVRTEFLTALHDALAKPENDPSLPLNLDFVYGSVESSANSAFCPLDGQQRLTTLFLLHWYLAWIDKKSDDFLDFIKIDNKSRFTYTVRTSSHEFFNALVSWTPEDNHGTDAPLSDAITDQPWFFRSWKLDPTIQSALTMLNAIHLKFSHAEGFYKRIVTTESPYITFQQLDLINFGLSDDLYIKMNARGKPLTSFETFKARLERHLQDLFPVETIVLKGRPVSIRDYVSHRIDTGWADIFWQHRDKKSNLFDDRLMNLIRAVAIITRDPGNSTTAGVLQKLRNRREGFSFLKYQENNCLDRPLIETLISVLDAWDGGSDGIMKHLTTTVIFDEQRFFEKVINETSELTYEELIQFHAYCCYLKRHNGKIKADAFEEWMRVIRNLSANTFYDGINDFIRSVRSINDLLNESDKILAYLSGMNLKVPGFNEQQVREERIKARLVLKSTEWRQLILAAEAHRYFKGQIEFMLNFSGVLDAWNKDNGCEWDKTEDDALLHGFHDHFEKASEIFSPNGLKDFGENRFERALLSEGNYLLATGRNLCFLIDFDRDISWKRLLRGSTKSDDSVEIKRRNVKTLFEKIDLKLGVEKSLDAILGQAKPVSDWQRILVENPYAIEFCANRMIRYESEGRVYLLKKLRMSGEHVELFSYHLYVSILWPRHQNKDFYPFTELQYFSKNTDSSEPFAQLIWEHDKGNIALEISNNSGSYSISLLNIKGDFPPELKADLIRRLEFVDKNGRLAITIDMDLAEASIDEVIKVIKEFENSKPNGQNYIGNDND